jgi:GMP synthase (glutamine-hydrolysing)
MQDMLLILNFDDRYASAAAIKLRGEGIYCRILPGDALPGEILALSPLGIVLAGGVVGKVPMSLDGRLLHAGIPILALGNTAASVAMLLNGKSLPPQERETVDTVRFEPSPLTEELSESERMLHTVYPLELTEEIAPIAYIGEDIIGFRHDALSIYGLGFQIESNDPDGFGILLRFAREVCGCTSWWNESAFISASRSDIAAAVGEGTAICAMTGGLDSGVSATLAHRALGDRLRCFFVDTGLLRENEAEDFLTYYREKENLHITRINAQERFLEALQGKTTQEEKRAAIDGCLRQVLHEAVAGVDYTAIIRGITCSEVMRFGYGQTLLPSEGKTVIAPLRELFKEEVRYVGEKLGMPPEITAAQPFPGSGLALRIHGEATPERLDTLRKADDMFCEAIVAAGLHKKLWKYYAKLYRDDADQGGIISLRAVGRVDVQSGGAATIPARLPYDLLERYVQSVRESCPEIRKVVYDVTPGGGSLDAMWLD